MPLVVEDGTGVVNANSYTDVEYARIYAASRGLTLPSLDSACEVALLNGMDYLESLRSRLQGRKTNNQQELQFPRTGVFIDNVAVPSDVIPQILIHAQIEVAALFVSGVNMMPVVDSQILREQIGPIATTYRYNFRPVSTRVDALINPLLVEGGAFRTARA